jgi:predicted Zn-dependent protease
MKQTRGLFTVAGCGRNLPLLALSLALAACGTNPVTGKTELQLVSEAAEISQGEQNYAPTRQSEGGDFTLDEALTPYINEVGQKLAAVSDRKLPYEFKVLNSNVPNAWALPGGKIAVNRGLLTELKSEAELAAVLGHEIVHAAARHGAKAQERGTLLQVGMVAAQVGLATSDANPNLANIAIQGVGLGAAMVQMKYGRDQESEADHYGMVYMQRAGYDLNAAVTLQETFVRLSSEQGAKNKSWIEGLFASHPPSEQRVQQNKATLAELNGHGGEVGTERYLQRTAALRQMKPAYDKYEQALAAAGKKDYAAANKLGAEAAQMLPREARFPQLLGDIALAEKRSSESIPYYEKSLSLDGNYFGAYLGEGIAQYRLGNKAKAEQLLARSNQLLPTAPAAYFLGNIARERGDTAGAMQLYQAAAGSESEYGQLASGEFQKMDLPRNPASYLSTGVQQDANGRVQLVLQNRSALNVTAVEVTPFMLAAGGQATQLANPRTLGMLLAPGKTIAVDAQIGTMSPEQAAALRFRIDGVKAQ